MTSAVRRRLRAAATAFAVVALTGTLAALRPSGAAEVERPVPGYVRQVPPESPEAREARHRRVAERRRQETLILVHRGATAFAPENTLEAHAAAMDRGADGVEIDIRRSKDGVLYLHHDDELGRTVRGSDKVLVKDLTYRELLDHELISYGSATPDTRPPTLAAVLVLARQPAMLLHLDIKEPGLDADIAALLDAADAWDHVVHINDYNSEALRKDKRLTLFFYKGWLHEAPEGDAARRQWLTKPGQMIMVGKDPAEAAKVLGRGPVEAVPMPEGLREAR